MGDRLKYHSNMKLTWRYFTPLPVYICAGTAILTTMNLSYLTVTMVDHMTWMDYSELTVHKTFVWV